MTPAERASAVAFALHNCALEAMTPDADMLDVARSYEAGRVGVDALVAQAAKHAVLHVPAEVPSYDQREQRERSNAEESAQPNRDAQRLARANRVFANTVLLAEHGWRVTGDLDELVAIHRVLYHGVFDDAGLLRTVDAPHAQESHMSGKAASARPVSFIFPASLIETGAMNVFTHLAEQRNLKALDRPDFVVRLAQSYDELGYLHPFFGGNASVFRIFASRLAHYAGWDLDWGLVDRDAYQAAKQRAYAGSIDGYTNLFDCIVRPANPSRVFLVAGWDQGPAH